MFDVTEEYIVYTKKTISHNNNTNQEQKEEELNKSDNLSKFNKFK